MGTDNLLYQAASNKVSKTLFNIDAKLCVDTR